MKTTPAGAFMHQARTQPKSAAFFFNEEVWTYERLAGIDSRSGGLAFRFCSGEQLTRTCDVIGARAFGERPQWRMRWKPLGSTWMRKRRMNSSTASVMIFRRSRRLAR